MWRGIAVCAVGLCWSEERWDMSMCAAVHMKATWHSPALWFMPLITTTQRCFQQQSSTEGWQQWDTCQSGDEKMSCYVAISFVTDIFFPFVFFICLYMCVYILWKATDEAKCEVESVFFWQNASLLLWGGGSVLHCLYYDLFPLVCPSYCEMLTVTD